MKDRKQDPSCTLEMACLPARFATLLNMHRTYDKTEIPQVRQHGQI